MAAVAVRTRPYWRKYLGVYSGRETFTGGKKVGGVYKKQEPSSSAPLLQYYDVWSQLTAMPTCVYNSCCFRAMGRERTGLVDRWAQSQHSLFLCSHPWIHCITVTSLLQRWHYQQRFGGTRESYVSSPFRPHWASASSKLRKCYWKLTSILPAVKMAGNETFLMSNIA